MATGLFSNPTEYALSRTPEPKAVDPRVRRVEAIMQHNLRRPLRLTELAQTVGLHESRLSHLFSMHFGVSPGRHLKFIRLQRAKVLLEVSSLSVKEVAAEVGFDASRFGKHFRETYGRTPKQHRRIARATDN